MINQLKKSVFPFALIALTSIVSGEAKTGTQPNIIFILTDDMGFGDIGCFGGNFAPTPNLDKLATQGIKFTNYYTASPICSASRCGFLTGMQPARWNFTHFLNTRKENAKCEQADFLPLNAPSVARMLKSAGYATGHFGKWHLGGGRDVDNAPSIKAYGFDEYCSTWESPDPDSLITSSNWIWAKTDSIKRWDRTEYFVTKALDFLSRHKNEPCYVNIWPDDVHTPWVPSDETYELYPNGPDEERKFKAVLDVYDRQMGRLFEGLKKMGLDKNTIIIFTSDNGPAPSFNSTRAAGFRGTKWSLYEGGINMPFMAWWPDHFPAGKVDSTSILSAHDLLPTFCYYGNAKMPENVSFDGVNIATSLTGKPFDRKSSLMWEYGRNQYFKYAQGKDRSPNCAIRSGNWKLLMNNDGSTVELYNLAVDKDETTNVADKNSEISNNLQKQLLNWRNSLPLLEVK